MDGGKGVFVAVGAVNLGGPAPSSKVGLNDLIEARFSELKKAIENALSAITAPGGGPAAVAAFQAAFTVPGPGLPGPLWPSPTGSDVVKSE
jgi:hypothetical protein